jgi:uncharacterized protein (TIGR03083 family)
VIGDDELAALTVSTARLRGIVEPLDAGAVRAQAYPTEWWVADVLSHLGSGAVIMRSGIDAMLHGTAAVDNQRVWDEWNAKSPDDKARDSLAEDRALVDRLSSLTDDERSRVHYAMGPMTLEFPALVGMRLNEHALHTWDIDVTFDPTVEVPTDVATYVVDNLSVITRFAGKAVGAARTLHVRTLAPRREFTLSIGGDSVSLEPCTDAHEPDLELPAESLVRLVYGRLDPQHTPSALRTTIDLDDLRATFPGF